MVANGSIVVPRGNDLVALRSTLDWLEGLAGIATAEVTVAAAGDPEGTARLTWPGDSTRAALMNPGAAEARGGILFLLPADSFPPLTALE